MCSACSSHRAGSVLQLIALSTLQPYWEAPASLLMPNMRRVLSADLKQAISKLDYLGMSVGEALCHFHNVHSLEEMSTLLEKERATLVEVVTGVASLLNWRTKAVTDELHALATDSVPGKIASQHNAYDVSAACPGDGEADAQGPSNARDSLSANGNFLRTGAHWRLLDVQENATEVIRNMAHVRTALAEGLISEDCIDSVLFALWESRQLAGCAARAVLAMENIGIPDATPMPRS